MLHLDEKQLKAMHTRTNLRRLLDYVANSQVEKIAKMCSKGLDPNFHCQESGGKFNNTRYNIQINLLPILILLSTSYITIFITYPVLQLSSHTSFFFSIYSCIYWQMGNCFYSP